MTSLSRQMHLTVPSIVRLSPIYEKLLRSCRSSISSNGWKIKIWSRSFQIRSRNWWISLDFRRRTLSLTIRWLIWSSVIMRSISWSIERSGMNRCKITLSPNSSSTTKKTCSPSPPSTPKLAASKPKKNATFTSKPAKMGHKRQVMLPPVRIKL